MMNNECLLTPDQQGLWFEYLLNPQDNSYNACVIHKIMGKLDIDRLFQAESFVVNHIHSVRTRFKKHKDGTITQYIIPKVNDFHTYIDLTEEQHNKKNPIEILKEIAEKPYDLENELCFRQGLVKASDTVYYYLVGQHHIIADAISADICLRMISVAYNEGEQELKHQFPQKSMSDYLQYLKNTIPEEKHTKIKEYWNNKLGGSKIHFDFGFRYPAAKKHIRDVIRFKLGEDIYKGIKQISRIAGSTPFLTLMGVFNALLYRYWNREDTCIVYDVNARPKDYKNVPGYFVKTLPLRTVLNDEMSFLDLIEEITKNRKQDSKHQDISFSEIIQEYRNNETDLSTEDLDANIFFAQTLFHLESLNLKDTKSETVFFYGGTLNIDLELLYDPIQPDLEMSLAYNSALFTNAFIQRLISNLKILIQDIIKNPSKKISQLEIISPAERHLLIHEYNDTKSLYQKTKTINKLFEEQVLKTPDNIALIYEGQTLTYAQLNERANQIAYYLMEQGVKADKLVGLCIGRSLEMVVAMYAIIKAGGAFIPIDPNYPAQRIEYILDNAHAELIVTESTTKTILSSTQSKLICIDELDCTAYNKTNPNVPISYNNLLYIIYTSGSTGKPKGIMIEHLTHINLVNWHRKHLKNSNTKNVIQFASISFDVSVQEIFTSLSDGLCLYLINNEIKNDLDALAHFIVQNEIHRFFAPYIIIEHLFNAFENAGLKSVHLKEIITAGEQLKISRSIKNFFTKNPECLFINHYGPSEAHVVTSYILNPDVTTWVELPPIGKAIDNTQVYILDKNKHLLPKGVIGELYNAGDGLARGYLKRKELTNEKFISNPFVPGTLMFKSADLVRYLEDGNIEFLGRTDDQLKIRGNRVELGEIEHQLIAVDGIKECVVLAKENSNGIKTLIAYVVTKNNIDTDSNEIKEKLALNLPEYLIPTIILPLEKLPVTPHGKVDKKALLNRKIDIETSNKYLAPRNNSEAILAEIWQTVMEIERIGVNDNFFELGGHSLLAIQLITRIQNEIQLKIPVKAIFENPTISKLSDYIKKTGIEDTKTPPIPLTIEQNNIPLSFGQERLWNVKKNQAIDSFLMPGLLHLKGKLDTKAIEASFYTIVDRHQILRTNFTVNKNQVFQQINATEEFKIKYETIEKNALNGKIEQELQKPFHFEKDLLFRISLYKINDNEHYVLINMHHIISDGWSLSILIKELVSLYNSYSSDSEPILDPLPIQYSNYSKWQKDYLKGQVLEEKMNYWKKQLHGIKNLELPTCFPRPLLLSQKGNCVHFIIKEELCQKLKELSKSYDASLFMTLLTSFGILLSRYSKQDDIAIGTPVANRNKKELENLIGFFVNNIVIRINLKGNPGFGELLEQVKNTTLSAYEYQDAPIEKVINEMNLEMDTSRSPLFQVRFALQNTPKQKLELPGLTIDKQVLYNNTSKIELLLDIEEHNNCLHAYFEYATDLFSKDFIKSLAENFKQLLGHIVEEDSVPIFQLRMLDEAKTS